MAELYKDVYQSKYREETAQIHAPLSLIEKTKAAVREEEKRLAAAAGQRREAGTESVTAQGSAAGLAMRKKQEGAFGSSPENADRQKQVRTFAVRKWAYPLTAVAAILILMSVSLTMRGLKSADMAAPSAVYDGAAESGAAYENAVESADTGGFYEEVPAGAPADYEIAEAPAAEESFTANGEMLEEAAAEDIMADMAEGAAEETDGLSRGDAANLTSPAEEKSVEAVEDVERELADEKSIAKKQAASGQKQEDVDSEDYTMEKVAKRPVRFNGSDVEICYYKGNTFCILEMASTEDKEKTAWEAYVETASKEGYVICGEAETVEDFLAAANQKLQEGE